MARYSNQGKKEEKRQQQAIQNIYNISPKQSRLYTAYRGAK